MRTIPYEQLQPFQAINLLTDPGHIGGPVVVPSVAIIRLDWSLDGGKVGFNVLHGRYSGAFSGSSSQATSIFTALTTGATWTTLAPFLATTTSLTGVEIKDINTPYNVYIPSTGSAVPGTSTGTPLPNEVAVVITLRSAKTGIQNRGRMYLPGLGTTALASGNVVAAAAVTAINNWAQVIKSSFSAQGYTLCIAQPARQAYTSPATGTQHPARAAQSVDVTTLTVRDNHWDTMRRRGLK